MATMTLNVYAKDDKKKIEKTYTAESYDLMLGTVDDLLAVIDVNKLNDDMAVVAMILKCYPQLKPFLKDVFAGLTDEELNRVKVKELIPTFKNIFAAIVEDLSLIKSGN